MMKHILSMYDGISCGQLALQRAGIKNYTYYASEIDSKAISVTQQHFPNTIQLGDALQVNKDTLPTPKIDLLIGGSPCQGFSSAGTKLGFEDKRAELFKHFVYLKETLKPTYFLLENVRMYKNDLAMANQLMGCEPIMIDSSIFSAQTRKRLYWTNIPLSELPDDIGLYYGGTLKTIPHGHTKERIGFFHKYPCITAQNPGAHYREVLESGLTRVISPEECEELQTLPKGYTSMLNKTNRYKCIGNGWTVDVVAWIFSHLPNDWRS